jgi:sortase (surface protein transpeptidase)
MGQPTASHQPCRPAGFAMPALGIDTSIVELALAPNGDLGTPPEADRASAGWYPSVLAGAARGTVLMDGHTYRDGSALFTSTFKEKVRAGMVMRLSCTDGHAFDYQVSEILLDVSTARYPGIVASRELYSADGVSRLVMITCTDYAPATRVWANRAIIVATPVG